MAERPLRADARRSRASLLEAYRLLAAERGADVALYEVARAAGLGQGTLYRHFPDRTALLAAVFEEEIDALERRAAADAGPDLLLTLLDAIVESQARLHGLSEALIAAKDAGPQLQHLAARTERLLRSPLAAAIAAGRVRDDLVLADVVAVMSMMEGMLIGLSSVEERRAAVDRGMRIIMMGLRPPDPARPGRPVSSD